MLQGLPRKHTAALRLEDNWLWCLRPGIPLGPVAFHLAAARAKATGIEVELEVLHCPGHTPGHVVFFHRPSRFAFVGDVLFAGSIGRTDLPGGDHATMLRSLRDRVLTLRDDVVVLPGHGEQTSIARERATNPFLLDLIDDDQSDHPSPVTRGL